MRKELSKPIFKIFEKVIFLSAFVQKLYTKAIKYYIKRRFYCVLRVFCATCIKRTLKPGSHLCDKHKHKLATFPHVKQAQEDAQESKAYASAATLGEIWKLIQDSGIILLVLVLTSRRFPLVK